MTRCSEPTAAVAKETITTAHPLTSKKMAWRANAGCMERRESVSLRNGQEEAVNACGHLMGLNTDETSEAQRIRTAGRGGHARTEEECHAVCPPQPPQTHSPRHSRTPASKWLSLFEPPDKSAGKGRKEGRGKRRRENNIQRIQKFLFSPLPPQCLCWYCICAGI